MTLHEVRHALDLAIEELSIAGAWLDAYERASDGSMCAMYARGVAKIILALDEEEGRLAESASDRDAEAEFPS